MSRLAESNPLVTGELPDGFVRRTRETNFLDEIDLSDLGEAKKAFINPAALEPAAPVSRYSVRREPIPLTRSLSMKEFVEAFSQLCGDARAQQLSYLFMKIDCNSDGEVSWDEFLSYVMLQDKIKSQPLVDELMQHNHVQAEPPETPTALQHREPACALTYVPKCSAYVSASHDGTLRVWSAALEHVLTVPLCEPHKTTLVVNDVCVLPAALGKMAVATARHLARTFSPILLLLLLLLPPPPPPPPSRPPTALLLPRRPTASSRSTS